MLIADSGGSSHRAPSFRRPRAVLASALVWRVVRGTATCRRGSDRSEVRPVMSRRRTRRRGAGRRSAWRGSVRSDERDRRWNGRRRSRGRVGGGGAPESAARRARRGAGADSRRTRRGRPCRPRARAAHLDDPADVASAASSVSSVAIAARAVLVRQRLRPARGGAGSARPPSCAGARRGTTRRSSRRRELTGETITSRQIAHSKSDVRSIASPARSLRHGGSRSVVARRARTAAGGAEAAAAETAAARRRRGARGPLGRSRACEGARRRARLRGDGATRARARPRLLFVFFTNAERSEVVRSRRRRARRGASDARVLRERPGAAHAPVGLGRGGLLFSMPGCPRGRGNGRWLLAQAVAAHALLDRTARDAGGEHPAEQQYSTSEEAWRGGSLQEQSSARSSGNLGPTLAAVQRSRPHQRGPSGVSGREARAPRRSLRWTSAGSTSRTAT